MTEKKTIPTTAKAKDAKAKEPRAPKKPKRRVSTKERTVDKTIDINVGIDLGDKYSQICEIDGDGVLTEVRLATTESKLREQFEGKPRRRIIMEVGSQSRWISELLTSFGHEVLVLDARHVKMISDGLYKDDRKDAFLLARMGREAPGLLKVVHHRALDHQHVLTLVRARACAVRGRTQVVNTLRGLLKPYGIRLPKHSKSSDFLLWMYDFVPPPVLKLIEPLLPLLQEFDIRVDEYDKQAKAMLPTFAPHAMKLTNVYGVGDLTVLYFVALIGDPKRFPKSRDVGAYLGLCRRRNDSGERASELRITKAGDPYMRALLSNCASHILGPFGKDCDLRAWGLKKAGAGSRVEKRKAKVAVARKLSVLLLTLLKSGKDYKPFRDPPADQAQA